MCMHIFKLDFLHVRISCMNKKYEYLKYVKLFKLKFKCKTSFCNIFFTDYSTIPIP